MPGTTPAGTFPDLYERRQNQIAIQGLFAPTAQWEGENGELLTNARQADAVSRALSAVSAAREALDQLCAPAVGFGKIAAKKLFGNKEFAFDMPLLMAIVLVIVANAVVCGVLGILGL